MMAGRDKPHWRFTYHVDEVQRVSKTMKDREPSDKQISLSRCRGNKFSYFTTEDVDDIKHVIHEIDNQQPFSEPDIGWMSPIKGMSPFPKKNCEITSSPLPHVLENKENESTRNNRMISHPAIDNSSLNTENSRVLPPKHSTMDNYQCSVEEYESLYDESISNLSKNVMLCIQEDLDKKRVQFSKPLFSLHSPTSSSSISQPAITNSENWSSHLPEEIIEKLRIAEEKFELELAKERSRSLKRLKEMLQRGRDAYMKELEMKLLFEWRDKRRESVLQDLHRATIEEYINFFLPNNSNPNHDKREISDQNNNILAVLMKTMKELIHRQLNNELDVTTQTALNGSMRKVQHHNSILIELHR